MGNAGIGGKALTPWNKEFLQAPGCGKQNATLRLKYCLSAWPVLSVAGQRVSHFAD